MSVLRFNPFLNDWVIIAANRQSRPDMPSNWCPFCPGSGKVPQQYDVYAYDNDFPVLEQKEPGILMTHNSFEKIRNTYGKCEVLLYHPDHTITLPQLPVEHIRKLIDLWCLRTLGLSKDKKIKYIFVFENRGKEVGVTMPHPHGQLYAFGWIPKTIQTELDSSKKYFIKEGHCLMCDILKNESSENRRVVYENEYFIAFVPYFSAWPYGLYIASKEHMTLLSNLDDRQRNSLADILKKVTGAYDSLFDRQFPYMMGIHQAPVNTFNASKYYHLHIEFYPPLRAPDKQYFRASCETSVGAYCNVTLPEESAAELRKALDRYLMKEKSGS